MFGNDKERDLHFAPQHRQNIPTMPHMREMAWVRIGKGICRPYGRCWDSDFSTEISNDEWVQQLVDHIRVLERHFLDIQGDLLDMKL